MIKRRFYRFEHANRDGPSGSSSSSGSEVEPEASDDTEVEDSDEETVVSDVREKGEASSSSGYESEDSSANEVNLDSSGLPTSDDDVAIQSGGKNILGSFAIGEGNNSILARPHSPKEDEKPDFDSADCVLKFKSVFKCRLCPRIVCLSEETLKAHLISKRHARSEKLCKEGRLKLMLNEKGQIEGDFPAENDATAPVSGQKSAKPNKKGKGRWKQRKRPRQEPKPMNRAQRRKKDS